MGGGLWVIAQLTLMPAGESSTISVSSGSRPNSLIPSRYGSGKGFALTHSSPRTTACNNKNVKRSMLQLRCSWS